jgi:hypothetical protein
MEMSHWENFNCGIAVCFYRHGVSYYLLYPPIVYTMFHIFPIKQTEEIRPGTLPDYRLININTHFRVRKTHDEFQNSVK